MSNLNHLRLTWSITWSPELYHREKESKKTVVYALGISLRFSKRHALST